MIYWPGWHFPFPTQFASPNLAKTSHSVRLRRRRRRHAKRYEYGSTSPCPTPPHPESTVGTRFCSPIRYFAVVRFLSYCPPSPLHDTRMKSGFDMLNLPDPRVLFFLLHSLRLCYLLAMELPHLYCVYVALNQNGYGEPYGTMQQNI